MKNLELRRLRTQTIHPKTFRSYTQVQAAELLGLHPNTLARYEQGELAIPETIARLARLTFHDPKPPRAIRRNRS